MRSYGPYLMATIMLVAINYIFLAIEANSSLKKLNTGAVTSAMLDVGSWLQVHFPRYLSIPNLCQSLSLAATEPGDRPL